MEKKILVTGSNGLLGQKLVKLILQMKEFELIATARGENRIQEIYPEMHYVQMDVCSAGEVMKVVEETKPDYIIHTAAMTQVDDCESDREGCFKLNVQAVQNLIDACKVHDISLVHLSTDFIFDGEAGPYLEEDEPNPLSYYGETKLEAEKRILDSGIHAAIARTVLVYGIVHKMSRSNIILWVKGSLENGKSIKVVNDQWRSPTLAEDLAMGCYLICKNDAKGIYNISGPDLLTPYDMAIASADFFKLDKSLISEVDGSVFTQPAKRPPKTGFVLDKAVRDLNYQPHTFNQGIEILARQIEDT